MTKISRRMVAKSVQQIVTDPEEIRRIQKAFAKADKRVEEEKWIEANEALTNKYLNRYVFSHQKSVVGTARGYRGLRRVLARLEREGIDTQTVGFKYLDPDPKPLILLAA